MKKINEKKEKLIIKIEIRHRNSPDVWTEVISAELGSINNPNTDILEVRLTSRKVINLKDAFGVDLDD
jgi:hypothetical protein